MLKLSVKVMTSKDNLKTLKEAMSTLEQNHVLVGIPAEKAPRTAEEAKGKAPTNALLGYVHEFGSPAQNIPARPFLNPGIENAKEQITIRLGKAAQGALDGNPDEVSGQLNAVGIVAASSVKEKISSNIPPPLGAATLAARRRRGRTGTRTLVDSGQLRQSLTYVIRPKA